MRNEGVLKKIGLDYVKLRDFSLYSNINIRIKRKIAEK